MFYHQLYHINLRYYYSFIVKINEYYFCVLVLPASEFDRMKSHGKCPFLNVLYGTMDLDYMKS